VCAGAQAGRHQRRGRPRERARAVEHHGDPRQSAIERVGVVEREGAVLPSHLGCEGRHRARVSTRKNRGNAARTGAPCNQLAGVSIRAVHEQTHGLVHYGTRRSGGPAQPQELLFACPRR
jgi:hypothetical protein